VQVPPVIIVTVAVLTVQMVVVVDVNVTASPDEAVALTVKGAAPKVLPARAANVTVCAALATVKLWLTLVAAL